MNKLNIVKGFEYEKGSTSIHEKKTDEKVDIAREKQQYNNFFKL